MVDKYWKDRMMGPSLKLGYSYDAKSSRSWNYSRTMVFEAGGNPAMDNADTSRTSMASGGHKLNMSMRIPLKTLGAILTDHDLSLRGSRSSNTGISEIKYGDVRLYSSQEDELRSRGLYYAGSMNVDISPSAKSYIGINAKANVADDGTDRAVVSDEVTSTAFLRNLTMTNQGLRHEVKGSIYYYGAVAENERGSLRMLLGYYPGYSFRKDVRTSLDETAQAPDMTNTHDYTYRSISNRISSSISCDILDGGRKKFMVNVGVDFCSDMVVDDERLPLETDVRKSFFSVCPFAKIDYSGDRVWAVASVKTITSQPSLEQLRDRIDNSNPALLLAGNSSLRQSYTCIGRIGLSNGRKRRQGVPSWNVSMNASYVANSIISKAVRFTEPVRLEGWGGYDVAAGTSLVTYENAKGTMDASLAAMISKFIRKERVNHSIAFDLNAHFKTVPMYVSECFCVMSDYGASEKLSYQLFWGKHLRADISEYVERGVSLNSLGQNLASRWNCSMAAAVEASFLKHAFLNVSGSYGFYKYDRVKTIQSSNSLNASLGYNFLDGDLKLSLSGSNLLDSRPTYGLHVYADSRVETWTPYFGRCVMMNVSYRFNSLKK